MLHDIFLTLPLVLIGVVVFLVLGCIALDGLCVIHQKYKDYKEQLKIQRPMNVALLQKLPLDATWWPDRAKPFHPEHPGLTLSQLPAFHPCEGVAIVAHELDGSRYGFNPEYTLVYMTPDHKTPVVYLKELFRRSCDLDRPYSNDFWSKKWVDRLVRLRVARIDWISKLCVAQGVTKDMGPLIDRFIGPIYGHDSYVQSGDVRTEEQCRKHPL